MIVNLADFHKEADALLNRIVQAAGSALSIDERRTAELAGEADRQIKALNADYLEALRKIAIEFEKVN